MAEFDTFEWTFALQAVVFWAVGLPILVYFFRATAAALGGAMPVDKAFIPSRLPHPNPDGKAVPFDVARKMLRT